MPNSFEVVNVKIQKGHYKKLFGAALQSKRIEEETYDCMDLCLLPPLRDANKAYKWKKFKIGYVVRSSNIQNCKKKIALESKS
jgi:hypothetical protein